jgi:hypothetical protein
MRTTSTSARRLRPVLRRHPIAVPSLATSPRNSRSENACSTRVS